MKRRLDLALALVHDPRILFLDEPTTGLDIQSRTALWEEVQSPPGEGRGRDRFPDDAVSRGGRRPRRSRRDHRPRPHRRGGLAGRALPARGGAAGPSRCCPPTRPTKAACRRDPRTVRRALVPATRGIAVRCRSGQADLAEIVRALDAESLAIGQLQLHQPSLDDVFLAKTGRSLEGAGDDEDAEPATLAMEPA